MNQHAELECKTDFVGVHCKKIMQMYLVIYLGEFKLDSIQIQLI